MHIYEHTLSPPSLCTQIFSKSSTNLPIPNECLGVVPYWYSWYGFFFSFFGFIDFFWKYLDYKHHLHSCFQSYIHNLDGKLRNVIAYKFCKWIEKLGVDCHGGSHMAFQCWSLSLPKWSTNVMSQAFGHEKIEFYVVKSRWSTTSSHTFLNPLSSIG
jgi:hypothetical protein